MMFAEPDGMIAQLLGKLRLFQDVPVITRRGAVNFGIVVGVVEQPKFHLHLPAWAETPASSVTTAPRMHEMFTGERPEAVSAARKIALAGFIRCEFRDLGKTEPMHFFPQLGRFEETPERFATSCGEAGQHAENRQSLLIHQVPGHQVAKDDLSPFGERGHRAECTEYCTRREIRSDAQP